MTTTHDWVQQGTVRAELEAAEARTLAPWAARSAQSAGRGQPEPEDPVRTCWMRDLDRIIFSRAMMRAHGKTQSFIPAFSGEGPAAGRQGGPYIGDHYVTRATHMQQTARIAATLAQALALNVPLASAIATGHDLGHACFGHGGEAALQQVAPGGFDHARQGARLLTLLEPRNLTAEVLDGIARHSWKHDPPSTLEGMCARLADRIAYLTADLTDALRAGVLAGVADVPAEVRRVLGENPADMIGVLVEDVIRHSRGRPHVAQGHACAEVMTTMRSFMFQRVYLRPEAERQTERAKRLPLPRAPRHHADGGEPRRGPGRAAGRRRHRRHDRPLRPGRLEGRLRPASHLRPAGTLAMPEGRLYAEGVTAAVGRSTVSATGNVPPIEPPILPPRPPRRPPEPQQPPPP